MPQSRLFTSESVSEGHPDKIADQISDAILDACLEECPKARVACETLITGKMVVLSGETNPHIRKLGIDVKKIVLQVIEAVGHTRDSGFDPDNFILLDQLGLQSPDIRRGVDRNDGEQGAGDQGLMFGYATTETPSLMPAPIYYAHRLVKRQAELRKSGCSWLRPDAKCQVTLEYQGDEPVGVEAIVLSTQHDPCKEQAFVKEFVTEEIIKTTLPPNWIPDRDSIHVNPTGRFVKGGPEGDAGLTGRKIIVDTYGGMARHGGGAFSGKDPSKVDRSAAYAARYAAKNVVAAGLASRCEIQVSYAIGRSEPASISVDTFETGRISDKRIEQLVKRHFHFRPAGMIDMLDLLRPIYRKTATYGHFGRDDPDFTWENTDRAHLLRQDRISAVG